MQHKYEKQKQAIYILPGCFFYWITFLVCLVSSLTKYHTTTYHLYLCYSNLYIQIWDLIISNAVKQMDTELWKSQYSPFAPSFCSNSSSHFTKLPTNCSLLVLTGNCLFAITLFLSESATVLWHHALTVDADTV